MVTWLEIPERQSAGICSLTKLDFDDWNGCLLELIHPTLLRQVIVEWDIDQHLQSTTPF